MGSTTSLHLYQRDPEFTLNSTFFLIMADFGESQNCFVRSVAAADHRPTCLVDIFPSASSEALGAELSKDYSQRTTLNGLSMFFGWIGGAGASPT